MTGASSGLGAHFADVLVAHGARVAGAARRTDRLAALAVRLGGSFVPLALDVTDASSVKAAVAQTVEAFGGLDIVVNNAGVGETLPAMDADEAHWDRTVDTNLKGPWLVAAANAMRERGGVIVNVASILGLRVVANTASYAVSKAGLVQMTQALALEWARHGIRVNALAPGYIETDMNRGLFDTPAGQAMIRRIPQRRLGRVEELEAPFLLLCSDASSLMTGAVLVCDGGHMIGIA